MEILLTTCTAEKSTAPGSIAACERYLGDRVARAMADSRPLYFLSGRYGLLEGREPIPWYDEALRPEAVAALVPRVVATLRSAGVTEIRFLAEDRSAPGWAPYWDVVEASAAEAGIPLIRV